MALLSRRGARSVRSFFEQHLTWAWVAEVVGLALIVGSILLMDRSTPFPGWFALPPVIGTSLIIAASSASTPVGRLLSQPSLVVIGLVSYSAYLWHQPLFALARAYNGFPLHWSVYLVLICLTFGLAFLSWKYVERPFRNRAFLRRGTLFAVSTSLALFLIPLGLLAHVSNGLPARFSDRSVAVARTMELSPRRPCHTDGRDYLSPAKACGYGGPEISWAVLGDSHGIEIGYALAEQLSERSEGVLHLTFSACPPALTYDPPNPGCRAWTEEALRRIAADKKIRNVLVAYRNGPHFTADRSARDLLAAPALLAQRPADVARAVHVNDFDRLIQRLRNAGKRVTVLGPVPALPVSADWIIFRQAEDARQPIGRYLQRQGVVLKRLRSMEKAGLIRLIEPSKALCDSQGCRTVIDGRAMYFDDNHLSLSGARRVLAREAQEEALP